MLDLHPPGPDNRYHQNHIEWVLDSYRRVLGKPLLDAVGDDFGRVVYEADFALLSHNTDPDPLFNYANRKALGLFELTWQELVGMPSRFSAEPVNREERERLLAKVARQGYIDDYAGVRIAKSGRRFMIRGAVVWNVLDGDGRPYGQAACFSDWDWLA
ncbi:MEKHLA domain-containing protein [Methylomonas sp. MED-D]|uniref:MEKHLA domain-containing protein n=1 Tax=Methylomonas sp. MED-D TaxID=3418768 RepID=UPI003D03BEEB